MKKCTKCGVLVEVINDCNCDDCGIKCCGEQNAEIHTWCKIICLL